MTAGSILAALAVILGAFGAHALKDKLALLNMADQLLVYEKGVTYQFYHCFALLITGIAYLSYPTKSLRLATGFFITGIILFSGSLYIMVMLRMSGGSLGMAALATPLGGLFFIAGWVALLMGILKKQA